MKSLTFVFMFLAAFSLVLPGYCDPGEIAIYTYEVMPYGGKVLQTFMWSKESKLNSRERLQFLSDYRSAIYTLINNRCYPTGKPMTEKDKEKYFKCLSDYCFVGNDEVLDHILLEIYSKEKYSDVPLEVTFSIIVEAQGPPHLLDNDYVSDIDYSLLYQQLDHVVAH